MEEEQVFRKPHTSRANQKKKKKKTIKPVSSDNFYYPGPGTN